MFPFLTPPDTKNMAIKTDKEHRRFRNELIFTPDAKAIRLENTLVNLFMLLKHNGSRAKARVGRGDITVDTIKQKFVQYDAKGLTQGASQYEDALEWWIRNNLLNLVYRGKEQEKVSSLKPIHLNSYVVRNAKHTRDYNSAEQVYLMLKGDSVKEELLTFLNMGWDGVSNQVDAQQPLDVDSLGVLRIAQIAKASADGKELLEHVQPLLPQQAQLFCDDVHRVLQYQHIIPRQVMMEYLKVLTGFHLALYLMTLIENLPEMVRTGDMTSVRPISFVLDLTDDPASKVAQFAVEDAAYFYDGLQDYIRSIFVINAALRYNRADFNSSASLVPAFDLLRNPSTEFFAWCKAKADHLVESVDEENRGLLEEILAFEDNNLDQYIELILKSRFKFHHYYHGQMLDAFTQKNSEEGFLAQGRSRKHPRRFVLGSKLLEVLIQILVLRPGETGFYSEPLSIEQLIHTLRERYGMVINGLEEPRFAGADVQTHQAFKENLEAFKQKLRNIGFYNVLSDAYIMQKIRPRYPIGEEKVLPDARA